MESSRRIQSLSDSSTDEENGSRPSFASPPKKRKSLHNYYEEEKTTFQSRGTVIVSPPTNCVASTSSSGFPYNAMSSSQDSETSDEEEVSEPSIHKAYIKPKPTSAPIMDQKAKAMMAKMGFKEGTGLGKHHQGRVQPIEVSQQRGRRGLGMQIKGLEAEEVEWDSSRETIEVEESVIWFPSHDYLPPTLSELRRWKVEGNKKLSIDDETNFCDAEVLLQVLECKSIFDRLEEEELRKARTRSNPFETIRGGIFLNRAAMKMANMDAVFDFMFTDPKTREGTSFVLPNELLYFADVCAGPGGFTEYVLWRKKWEAKGFGFTLKGSNDFKLEEFHVAPSECFEPHYGLHGIEGDGDVYRPENIKEFTQFVLSQTEGKGVHFMMADGGFGVEGQENLQEILSKRLYLCQFLVALSIVRIGGHFTCKLFDVFTPFSAGLVYLMYRSFEEVCIHKPNTSRPANSERYIVCKWKKNDVQDVEKYLYEINCRLMELSSASCKIDVLHIVPLDLMFGDSNYSDYLRESNNSLGMRQVINLAKIAAFCKDTSLREDRQSELKKQCLDFWKIPDKARTAPHRAGPSDKAKELLAQNNSVLGKQSTTLTGLTFLQDSIKSVYDWRCIVLGLEANNSMQTFFLGLGKNNVFRWDVSKLRWHKLTENIELVRDTLFYGEMIQELRGEGRSQKRSHTLHIIDAVYLGGVDISQLHLKERHEKIRLYAKSLNKASRTDLVTIRAKESFKLEDLNQIFERLVPRIIKNSGCQERLVFSVDDDTQRAYLPSGLLIYKATKNPWMLALSKSSGRKYWYNVMNRQSLYECPKDSITSFFECHNTRLTWWWNNGASQGNVEEISKADFASFVYTLCGK